MDKVDNTQSMYKYDREELENYTKTAEEVKKLQAQQTQQKSSLEAMKQEQEGAKANLEALKEQAQAENENYDQQIAQAQATADEYYALIEQQNAQIAQLQEQKAAEDEAARQAAEAEAARQAAEQEAAQNVQTSGETYTGNDGDAQSDAGYSEDTSSYSESTGSSEAQTTVSAPVSAPASNGTGVSGSAIASYACQFTGNPYVWGGTSLTNGADCSGFVQSVYRQFGINLSRTTYTQANEGVAVSYNDMQPGDVINYGFHTAIYIGNNQIVHAADESLGIIVQSNPAYQPIVTIRRFV
jgi:cell wall-associated NlpC family hydrolase